MHRFIAIVLVAFVGLGVVVVASPGQGPPPFDRQPSPEAVVAEHLDALNDCDVDRLMAQYPETVAILLPGGVTVEGRTDVRALFEGFCKPHADGGLNGITFAEVKSWTVGKTVNVQWVATAPFLAAPYYGADAYVTQNGLMGAQVTTFDGTELQFVP